MKEIRCSSCGSNEIEKVGEYYVCQSCGTKYNDDDIKRLVLSGSVTIDNTETIKNRYIIARQAISNDDFKDAAKQYNYIRENLPNDWEAMFFSAYAESMQTNISGIEDAAGKIKKYAATAIKAIGNSLKDEDEIEIACKELFRYSEKAADILFAASKEHYNKFSSVSGALGENQKRVAAISNMMLSIGDAFEETFKDSVNICYSVACGAWKKAFDICYLGDIILPANEDIYKEKIQQYDNKYEPKLNPSRIVKEKTIFACYVATAVYGSYDCPQVWILRRYRDYRLSKVWYGRLFVKLYYAISPVFVKKFSSTVWFNKLFKWLLDRITMSLKEQGFADTPYNDMDF